MPALSPDWLRKRCEERRQELNLQTENNLPEDNSASVLIPVVAQDSGLSLLLTRRTEFLRHHPGQICFPGGRAEAGDSSPICTALREAREEIGLDPLSVEVLACLPGSRVSSGFLVTPVLGFVRSPLGLNPDPAEVAEIFEVPLDHVMEPQSYQCHRMDRFGVFRQVHSIAYRGRFIWGATAGFLVELSAFLGDPG